MPRFHCLLCNTEFDRPSNHFCARECQRGTDLHFDFCRPCRAVCLKAFEPQLAESTGSERRPDRK